MRIPLPKAIAEYVAKQIERYATDLPHQSECQALYSQKHDALPLLVDWTSTFGITLDGRVVEWSTDEEPPWVREVDDRRLVRLTLARGALVFPGIAPLVPRRTPSAISCPYCRGSGTLDLPDIVCFCGGLGWLEAGEILPSGSAG